MIVLTSVKSGPLHARSVIPGDTFSLSVSDHTGIHEIITEEVTVAKTIDFIASFRFAREDGTVQSFHLSGFFGDSENLPEEMKNAKRLEDLTESQRGNFLKSVGCTTMLK
jgi:hypothetical protein